ncbi:leukocyte receptor cluster member 9 isoform X2 [Phyllopteryx taeniolatus]|uniref:leukocyte receptor cluster member 9 isoform X2 n=2 Tax=Phyllopteryx taeniolatus TaxID=161469 RepID=UPI002AD2A66F|nr:leukocyte receptor cluster member 9 isoform X2 [Phyllopteryx taeniolatus]
MASECSGVSSSTENAAVQIDTSRAEGPAHPEDVKTDEKGVDVCPFFLEGKCHFGVRCRMSHRLTQLICEVTSSSLDPAMAIADVLLHDPEDKRDEEKQKNKDHRHKTAKPKENVNKKSRMRTADDVISRILWDSSVDASQFVVGYVDRFLGVMERPFSDFNWDTNPGDCDYTEIALPRHRIQYFTYRSHRVWDRHSRTDRVFGSTGQSLAPPFGGEEEVGETQLDDQEQQERVTLDHPESTRAEPPAGVGQRMECTQAENTHLEEDKHSEMNARTSELACDVEEAPNSVKALTDKVGLGLKDGDTNEKLANGEESFEGQNNLNLLAPLEQREESCGLRRPKKKPTHFITFRANTPAILSCFQQLQEEICALLPSSAPHWQDSSSLHVTLCLLVLAGPAEVEAAEEILRRFAHFDRNPPVTVSFTVKLKDFNGRVLYLSPQPQLPLQQLNGGLQEAYRSKGLLHRNSYNPRYHLTLAKVKGREGERIFNGVGDLKVGRGLNFGRLPVNSLHLCVIEGADVDGFYETVCTVTLR